MGNSDGYSGAVAAAAPMWDGAGISRPIGGGKVWSLPNVLTPWLLDIVTAFGPIGALLVGIGVYRRQMNAQMYLEYTKRCDQIMRCFPREVRLDLAGAAPGSVDQLLLLRYLNLCSEEFCMWKNWYLSRRVWRIWEEEIKRFLRSPLARAGWKELRKEFDSFEQFQKYVDTV